MNKCNFLLIILSSKHSSFAVFEFLFSLSVLQDFASAQLTILLFIAVFQNITHKSAFDFFAGKTFKKSVSCCAGIVFDDADERSFVIAYGGPECELIIEKISGSDACVSLCSVSFAPAFVVSVALHALSKS